MAFTDQQSRALKAKLGYRDVKTRLSNGATLHYVEGWHVIAEANRIFGFDGWSRTTLSPQCVWTDVNNGQTVCCYSTRVRITVRAGDHTVTREGIGASVGRGQTPDQAHEMALKAAETDATKRALATFGNRFGLALYDKDQAGVTKPSPRHAPGRKPRRDQHGGEPANATPFLTLAVHGEAPKSFKEPEAFANQASAAIAKLETVEQVYAFWEANLGSLVALKRECAGSGVTGASAETLDARLVAELKQKARTLALRAPPSPVYEVEQHDRTQADKAVDRQNGAATSGMALAEPQLLIPKERRLRDTAHLAFVARQPCLVCGRRPAQAHHLRYAQPRAMAMKVSDEFTVPLCNLHHDNLHRAGDERGWWARHAVKNPLAIAARLWAASRGHVSDDDAHDDASAAASAKIVP